MLTDLLLIIVFGGMVVLAIWVVRLLIARPEPGGVRATPKEQEVAGGGGSGMPAQVIDLKELTTWVMNHLPESVSGSLDAEDVRRIVEWNLDFIKSKRASTNGHASKPATQVIVAGAETAEYVLEQATANGLEYTPVQVHAVLDAQMAYLESIGAAGPEIEPG